MKHVLRTLLVDFTRSVLGYGFLQLQFIFFRRPDLSTFLTMPLTEVGNMRRRPAVRA